MTDIEGDGIVQFKTIIEAALLQKSQLIRIHDSAIYNVLETGRIISYTSTLTAITIVLDREIALTGVTYLLLYKSDGTILEILLNQTTGNYSTITAVMTGIVELIPQSLFVQKTPRTTLYKVTNITRDEDYYTVEAIKYDARKYDFIEAEVIVPAENGFIEIIPGKTAAVTNISIKDFPYTADPTRKRFTLVWEHATQLYRVYTYKIEWDVSTGQFGVATVYTKEYDFDQIVNTAGASYFFTITASSSVDLPSNPTTFSFVERRWDDGTYWSITDPNDNYAI